MWSDKRELDYGKNLHLPAVKAGMSRVTRYVTGMSMKSSKYVNQGCRIFG